jgi:neutral ceramidase
MMVPVLLALVIFKPIEDQPISNYSEVRETKQKFENINFESISGEQLSAGWTAVNITPPIPVDLAGYGPRGPYKTVLDSTFARIILFDNQHTKAVIISVDLLMFPRLLKNRLEKELIELGFSKTNLFFTATHTHHGFGNWEQSLAGEFAFGQYNETLMDTMVVQIIGGVSHAEKNLSPLTMGFQKINAGELVMNRLAPKTGKEDPYLRLLHLQKADGKKAIFISFSGHATNLNADSWELSRDYPGILIDQLESIEGIDFAMFGAGMVGSHNIDIDIPKGHRRIEETGKRLAEKMLTDALSVSYDSSAVIGGLDIDIGLPQSQMRLTKNIVVRDWVFSSVFGPLEANIKALRIGNILFIGMPCDYSGELSVNSQLDEYASQKGMDLFITSFNGNYVGYITEDAHYNTRDHDEVKTMNWVGPHMGVYFTDAIVQIINACESNL